MPLTPRPLAPLALRLVEIPGIPRVRGVQAVGLARLPTLIRGGASPLRRAAEQHPAQHRDLLRQLRDPGIGLRERLLGPLGTLTPVRHISGVTGHRREGHVLQNTPSPSNTPRTAPGVSRTKPQPRRRPRLQTHAALTPHVTTGGHSDSARPPTGSPNTYKPAAIFHSDRGSNYTSAQFAKTLHGLDIRQSVGRTGSCYDNAMAESFFGALKTERVHRTQYPTRRHAINDVARYIEAYSQAIL